METPNNQILPVMLISSTWLSPESTKWYALGWVCEDISWKHKLRGRKHSPYLPPPPWTLPSHDSPSIERFEGKAMVLLFTHFCFLLLSVSNCCCCCFGLPMWSKYQKSLRILQASSTSLEQLRHPALWSEQLLAFLSLPYAHGHCWTTYPVACKPV